MVKEGAYPEVNSNESIEPRSGFSKEALKSFVESRERIDGSGKSGIVFRVAKEELSPEDQKVMDAEDEDNPEGSVSIKALKVFDIVRARREFESLQEARKIILQQADTSSAPLARIPRGLGLDEIKVDERTQKFLNDNGAVIVDGKVGIITMDWIEGKDLGAILREELLKRTSGEDAYRDRLWNDPNCDELIRVLEKKGFVLPRAIVDQIKNTVDAIHAKNFYHRDLHPGNIILKDGNQEDPRVYMIDWADATHGMTSLEETEGEYFLSDDKMIKNLIPLTKTPEDKKRAIREAVAREWDDRIALLGNQPKAQQQYTSLKKAMEGNEAEILEKQLISFSGFDRDIENFLAHLLKLARENEAHRTKILAFLKGHTTDKKSKIRNFILNRMRALESAIEI